MLERGLLQWLIFESVTDPPGRALQRLPNRQVWIRCEPLQSQKALLEVKPQAKTSQPPVALQHAMAGYHNGDGISSHSGFCCAKPEYMCR